VDRSFNEFQLILCRNVLIYFEPELQRRVHRLLHESLSADGFLVLGRSEALPQELRASYADVDAREKIFQRRAAAPAAATGSARGRPSGDADARDRHQHLAQEHE
jgi:chemotaxis methyl-accepting protein methylase